MNDANIKKHYIKDFLNIHHRKLYSYVQAKKTSCKIAKTRQMLSILVAFLAFDLTS